MDIDPATSTLLLILGPLLATGIGQRLFLHLVAPNLDLFVAGYNVHHLFCGVLLAVPAAFVVAFVPQECWLRWGALAALGASTAMVLDEVVFLIVTDGSNAAYPTRASLWGAIVLEALAAGLLVLLYALS